MREKKQQKPVKRAREENTNKDDNTKEQQPSFKRQKQEYSGERRERKPKKEVKHERVKPGEALSSAQRQKPTVQEFKGNKIVFD